MGKAHVPIGIDDTIQWHAAKLKELHLLPIFLGNQVVRVWQANKGNLFILPVLLKGRKRAWPNGQNFHTTVFKLFIVIP